MTDHRPPFITAVNVNFMGAHAHVSVFIRGKLTGELVTDLDDARRLRSLLLRLNASEALLGQALQVAEHWSAQEGINAGEIDVLCELADAYQATERDG